MAAIDARAFPEYGVAQRVHGTFTLVTTGKESSGALTNLAAFVSKDNGAWVACDETPVQQGTTGIVYVDLTAAEMEAHHVRVKFTSDLSNAVDVIVSFSPLVWQGQDGRGQSRFEELVRKVTEYILNEVEDTGSAISVKQDDGTESLTGPVNESETAAVRGKLT